MRSESSPLTTADLVVLSLLAERPQHGYELFQEFDRIELTEWSRVSKPHLYYALRKLARAGLLECAETGARDKAVYRVSETGETALRNALGDDAWSKVRIPAPFSTWLGLSVHAAPEDRARILAARADFLRDEIVRKTATLDFIREYQSIRAEAGVAMVELYIAQCRTEMEWVERLTANAPRE